MTFTSHRTRETLFGCCEYQYQGFDIHIENNPDAYTGGFVWSISNDDVMHDEDLAFTLDDAKKKAELCVEQLIGLQVKV